MWDRYQKSVKMSTYLVAFVVDDVDDSDDVDGGGEKRQRDGMGMSRCRCSATRLLVLLLLLHCDVERNIGREIRKGNASAWKDILNLDCLLGQPQRVLPVRVQSQLCGGVYILFFCKVSFQKHPSVQGPTDREGRVHHRAWDNS